MKLKSLQTELTLFLFNEIHSQGGLEMFTEYTYSDAIPLSDLNYYRLKAVDHDGTFEYSDIISVMGDGSGPNVKVFPNPVVDHLVLNLNFIPESPGLIQLYDFRGDVVFRTRVEDFRSKIYLPEGLKKGSYILGSRFNEVSATSRIVVE